MNKELDDLILKDLSGNCTPEEKTQLQEWIKGNEIKYKESKEIWEKSFDNETIHFNENKAWEKLSARIAKSSQPKVRSFRTLYIGVAAMALFVLSVSFWLVQNSRDKESYTSNSYLEIFYLPDGTQVWLNKNSTITLENFSGSDRIVKLVGEAYFKVVKDPSRPFTILAGSSKTRVLGTEFVLKAYPDQPKVEINVQSGRVEFSSLVNKSSSKILYKDESGYLTNQNGLVSKVEKPYKEAKWIASTTQTITAKPKVKGKLIEATVSKNYLHHSFNFKDNIFKQVVIDGELKNDALYTAYKNIKVKVTYKTKDDETIVENQDISELLKPGQSIKYKFRVGSWFKRIKVQSIEIEDAHAIQTTLK